MAVKRLSSGSDRRVAKKRRTHTEVQLLKPSSTAFYYKCTRLHYYNTHVLDMLQRADLGRVATHLRDLFRAWTNPHLFQELYLRGEDMFVTGFRAQEGDRKVSDRAHVFIDCRNTRTNNGANGSAKGNWNAWQRYLTYYACGKQSYRPFKKHPDVSTLPVDHHDEFLDPWIKMKGGQGNSSAAKVRVAWTDDNGSKYEPPVMAFMTEETLDGTINSFVAPSYKICRTVTSDDIQDMRYAYSAGMYWNVSSTYDNDVKMSWSSEGMTCEDRHSTAEQQTLWEQGGPLMDEWTMTSAGFDALFRDVKDFLYTLKIFSSCPDKTCLLSEELQTASDVETLRQRAETLFQDIYEDSLYMLHALKQRI